MKHWRKLEKSSAVSVSFQITGSHTPGAIFSYHPHPELTSLSLKRCSPTTAIAPEPTTSGISFQPRLSSDPSVTEAKAPAVRYHTQ